MQIVNRNQNKAIARNYRILNPREFKNYKFKIGDYVKIKSSCEATKSYIYQIISIDTDNIWRYC